MFDDSEGDRTESYSPLTAGTAVAQYRILKKIGAGGMGEVYLAEDTRLKRRVALKFLAAHLCREESCRRRFRREAEAAAQLDHPSIVAVHELGEYQGRPYFVMQLAEGRTLNEISRDRKLSAAEVVSIGAQICDGLQSAHASGVIHRDIKPANVMVDDSGRARILDFGLASVAEESRLTQPGARLGTLRYMSPEQVRLQAADARSDLFAVGVMMFELLTGSHPFPGDSADSVSDAIQNKQCEFPEDSIRAIPLSLRMIVLKCLAKRPQERFGSAGDMAEALRSSLSGEVTPRVSGGSGIERRRGRRSVWLVAAVIAIVATVLALVPLDDSHEPVVIRYESGGGEVGRLAVMPFRHVGDEQEIRYTAAGFSFGIEELARGVFQRQLVPQEYLRDVDPSNYRIADVREAVSCDYLLTGAIAQLGTQYQVSYQLLDAVDSSVLDRRTLPAVGEADLPELEELIVQNVISVLAPGDERGQLRSSVAMCMGLAGRRHFDRAVYFLDHNEYELALESIDLAEQASGQPGALAYYKAQTLEGLRRYEEAIEHYRRALPDAEESQLLETIWSDDSARLAAWFQDTLVAYAVDLDDSTVDLVLLNLVNEEDIWTKRYTVDTAKGLVAIVGGNELYLHGRLGGTFTEFEHLDAATGQTKWMVGDSVSKSVSAGRHSATASLVGGGRWRFGSVNTWSAKYAVIDNLSGEVLCGDLIDPQYLSDSTVVCRPDTAFGTMGFYLINFRTGDTLVRTPDEVEYVIDSLYLTLLTADTSRIVVYRLNDGREQWSWSVPDSLRGCPERNMLWRHGDYLLLRSQAVLTCLVLESHKRNGVAWQRSLSRDRRPTYSSAYREGPGDDASVDWLVEADQWSGEVRVQDVSTGDDLYVFDLSAMRGANEHWYTCTIDSTIYVSANDWGAILVPRSGDLRLLKPFPLRASPWTVKQHLLRWSRLDLVLDDDGSLSVYAPGSEKPSRVFNTRVKARYLTTARGEPCLIGSSGVYRLSKDRLEGGAAITMGDILARISSCKLLLGKTDSARVYNARAIEALGHESPRIADNRYRILREADSLCYAGDAMMDCWLMNRTYKAARDSIFIAIRDSLSIDWVLSSGRKLPSAPGFVYSSVGSGDFRSAHVFADESRFVFALQVDGGNDYVCGINSETGELAWRKSVAGLRQSRFDEVNLRIRADDTRLAVVNDSGAVVIFNYATGDQIAEWSLDIGEEKYALPNWASDLDCRFATSDNTVLVVYSERQVAGKDEFDLLLNKYTWAGELTEQAVVREGIPTNIAKGSGVMEAGEYLVCWLKPYRGWGSVQHDDNMSDTLLVIRTEDLKQVSQFAVDSDVVHCAVVGEFVVAVDSTRMCGYHIPHGEMVFSSPLAGVIGNDDLWLSSVGGHRFLLFDSLTVSGWEIVAQDPPALDRLFRASVSDFTGSTGWVITPNIMHFGGVRVSYRGHCDGRLYFLWNGVLTCLADETGERVLSRPIIQGRWYTFDLGLHSDYTVMPAGDLLFRFANEDLCD